MTTLTDPLRRPLRRASALALTLLVAGASACSDGGPLAPDANLVELASATPELGTLTAAIGAAGLADALQGTGPFTVFAPTDLAFSALPAGTVDALLDNPAILQDLLRYHVVSGDVLSSQLSDGQRVVTLAGDTLEVRIAGGVVTVDGARVVAADVRATNGTVHLIDAVLTGGLNAVERAVVTPDLSTLLAAVQAAGLAEAVAAPGEFTIFAPINSAFAALPAGVVNRLLEPANLALLQKVLTYHVVPGAVYASDLMEGQSLATLQGETLPVTLTGGARVGGARVVAADIRVSNGVVHLIDGVMTGNLDLVDMAIANGFETLVSAVAQAGLADALRSDNGGAGFTVFAPTNAAFQALGAVPSNPTVLGQVLLYHVVSGRALSTGLQNGQVVATLHGGSLTIQLQGGVRVIGANGSANVVLADVAAKNGVIHVIDAVLVP